MKLQTFSVFFIFAIIGFLGNIHVQANSDRVALLFAGESNTYLFGQSGEAIIIDAGADPNLVISAVVKAKLTVKYIILTHAHHDHIPYVNTLRVKLKAKVILHQKDLQLLRQTSPDTIVDAVAVGGENLIIGGINLKILHTPGHSPGSVCVVADNMVFTGDTLFHGSIGRTDFNGGSLDMMKQSLKTLMELRDDLTVCPGHGGTSAIGFKRVNNPWIK